MNFYDIVVAVNPKTGVAEVKPDFRLVRKNSDLMVRGRNFYAVWNEKAGVWSTEELDIAELVDEELMAKKVELENAGIRKVDVKTLERNSTRSWIEYKGYISRHPDQFRALDDKLTFADDKVTKKDYVSKRLSYNLKPADHKAYDELMETLYSPEERTKIEWAIGSIVSGDSKEIQKFYVLYGKGGTGKGTILKIIKKLFEGYTTTFCAKDLTMSSKEFSMETFASNPLVAIDQDGDLSRIEDATRVNSIVSHEEILINVKGQPHFPYTPHCTLFIGSNEPVKIKDEESGLIRRLIDIEPTGKTLPSSRYKMLMQQIKFELGGIAYHCLQVYKKLGPNCYDGYRPQSMLYRTNAFTNFIFDRADDFIEQDGVSLKTAYQWWTQYCDEAGVTNRITRHKFGDELKNFFYNFEDRARVNGVQVRSWYSGFHMLGEEKNDIPNAEPEKPSSWLEMNCTTSLLDDILKDCIAQYVDPNNTDKPATSWSKVKTHLRDLDTKQLHYILPPEWLFMIDFDLKNDKGEKDRERNLEAASKWPATYAEFSKSGAGIHLYYRYSGDLQDLLSMYADDVEVKVYNGKAAIRRCLSFCNDIPIATISSGLPKKEKKKEAKKDMVDISVVELERYLINCIRKAMKSARDPEYKEAIETCKHTRPACIFIKDILDKAYESGKSYDVSQMRKSVYGFAMGSHNAQRFCTDLVSKMKWHSADVTKVTEAPVEKHKWRIAFFDIEVFPNVNMVNWKIDGPEHPVVRLINPKPSDIEELLKYDLIGFNNRKYDNHILHAIRLGYKPEKVYEVSKAIISGNPDGYFREAWDYSLSDILDFSSEKKSLKKFEIDLGIHHQELGMDWDKPVPEEKWTEVAEYCDNDVLATEALFHSKKRQADWTARQILADIAGMSVNSTTNSLTTRIIFGGNKNPQSSFNYRFMGGSEGETYHVPDGDYDPEYTLFDVNNRPIFPGYKFECVTHDDKGVKLEKPHWVSTYRGEEVGEGGYVYSEPGIYNNVALLDIASMHPSSIVAEELFGPKYTKAFSDILHARIFIKHKQYDKAKELFDGKLSKYLDDPDQAKALAGALKIAINSVYGLTSAKFDNPFRDQRNADNIVAKRGALFMVNLKHEVQRRGFTVAHIKTDSIKIPDATNDIIKFVMYYGKLYGYNFEHEATYDRMCLITKADYVAKFMTKEDAEKQYGYIPSDLYDEGGNWTETGDWFKDPYLFKTLFTHEPITIDDMYEVNSVTSALYLDMNENLSKEEHNYIFVGKCGAFCPVIPGSGGGELLRENKGKYDSANGAKGYRWKEYEVIRKLGLEDQVDRSYYDKRTAEAKAEIDKLGSYDLFVSDLPYPTPTNRSKN